MALHDTCPCVTVLIPARNAERFIRNALLSVLQQEHLSRILVVVNASSDKTEEIVRGYAQKFNKIDLISVPTAGIANALNTGLQTIDTKYMARLDADDEMVAGRIEVQVHELEKKPWLTVLGSQIEYIDSLSEVTGVSKYPSKSWVISVQLGYKNPIAHPSVLVRMSALSENPYNPLYEGVEDLALWINLSNTGQLENLPIALTRYRRHESQVSLSPKSKYQEMRLRKSSKLFLDKNLGWRILRISMNFLKILWVRFRLFLFEAKNV
jgi:glycosyltransferase involved in cell wall biosynthesis